DTYIRRMFERQGQGTPPYAQKATLRWLSWLACKMRQHSQGIFLLEQLQPTWLPTRQQQWLYALCSSLIVGPIFGSSGGLILELIWGGQEGMWALGLMVGLVGGLVYALRAASMDQARESTKARAHWQTIIHILSAGLVVGLSGSLIGRLL